MRPLPVALLVATIASSVQASPWGDPLDPIVIATGAVASRQKPVLRVLHEGGPGGWQLYDGGPLMGKPVVLPKVEVLKLDPSLQGVIDLPVDWEATRKSRLDPWVRRKAQ